MTTTCGTEMTKGEILSTEEEGRSSRRTLLKGTMSGAALAAVGASNSVLARNIEALLDSTSSALQKPIVTVAALQWMPDSGAMVGEAYLVDLERQLRGIAKGVGHADLLVVSKPPDREIDLGNRRDSALREFTRVLDCYLVVPTNDEHTALLYSPASAKGFVEVDPHSVVKTKIGNLMIVPEGWRSDAVATLEAYAPDILIRYDSVGYEVDEAKAFSAMNKVFSILVTAPQTDSFSNVSATAIVSPNGEILTRTSGSRNQAVTAKLGVEQLRKERRRLLHTVV